MLPDFCVDCDDFVCCTTLYDTARDLLAAAWDAYSACAGPDCCAPVSQFVAATEPHLATQDYLAVWVNSLILPTKSITPRPKDFKVQQPTAAFGIKLVESGWPVIEQVGTGITEPSGPELSFASMHSLGHAEALYTGVLKYVLSDACGTFVENTALRSVTSSGLIGWTFSVTLELRWR